LFELLKQNYFQGLSLNSIRFILKQILEALLQLQKADLIHCDLKPENILLKIDKENKNEILIKVTDFGSACFKDNTFFQYIQSRYYRAPETIVGYPYSMEIDMWSLGCIAAELFIGEPLLPGSSEFDQLYKIVEFIGEIPNYMLKVGKNTKKYFNTKAVKDESGKILFNKFELKELEEYFNENPKVEKPKYQIPSGLTSFDDIVKVGANMHNKKIFSNLNITNTNINTSNNQHKSRNTSIVENELNNDITANNITMNNKNKFNQNQNSHNHCSQNDLEAFDHFLKGLLQIDPKKRWNAKTALRHPFILKEKFDGNFQVEHIDEISLFVSNETLDNSVISDLGYNFYNNFNNAQQQRNFMGGIYLNNNTNIDNGNQNFNRCTNANLNGMNNSNHNNNYSNTPMANMNYLNNQFNNIKICNQNFNTAKNMNFNCNLNNNRIMNNYLNINNFNNNNSNYVPNNNYYNNINFNLNYKNCQSMIMHPEMPESNDNSSFNSNSYSNNLINKSLDYSCYQPNICNIPLQMLRNFPFGKIDNIDLKSNKKQQFKNKDKNYFKNKDFNHKSKKNNEKKYIQNKNKTFTMDNFNKLGNHSFTHENFYNNSNSNYNFYNQNYNFNNQACNDFNNMNLGNNYQFNILNTSNDR